MWLLYAAGRSPKVSVAFPLFLPLGKISALLMRANMVQERVHVHAIPCEGTQKFIFQRTHVIRDGNSSGIGGGLLGCYLCAVLSPKCVLLEGLIILVVFPEVFFSNKIINI